MSGKSISSGAKNPPKYFKWSLEKRLLLIDTVTKVDEEQDAILRTVKKVVDSPDCGTTGAPAAATVPLTTKEKWQEIASRMPPEMFQDIDRTKLESTCRSQFVKLHQRLQLMTRDSHDRYTRHGKPDEIMTDEICQKIAQYRATYLHRGRRRSDLDVKPKKHAHAGRPRLHKGRGELVSVSNDKQPRAGRRRKLARGRPPLHKVRREDAPGNSDKQQGTDIRFRKLARGRRPLRKGNGEHVLVRKIGRGHPPLQKGIEHVCLSDDEPLCTSIQPEKRATQPSQEHRGEPGGEHALVRDDKQGCTVRPKKLVTTARPAEDRGEPGGEHAPEPVSDDKQRCTIRPEKLVTTARQVEDSVEPGGKHAAPVSGDKEFCTEDGGEHTISPVVDDKQVCTVPPELDGGQVVAIARGRQKPQSQQLSKTEALETKLCKAPSFPRAGMFRWSEAARVEVIQGVKTMNKNTEAGKIRSWREVAEGLPMRLFWDIDLDRLAIIAKKQFSEMRRRYRILKDNEMAGVVVKFKTITKRVRHELEEYEEGCLRRTPHTPSLCGSSQDRLWVTKRPAEAHNGEFSNAEGDVLVETFSSSENGVENDSSRFDPADEATGRRHQRNISRADDMESSDFDRRGSFQRYSNSEESMNSESRYREFIQKEDLYAKFNNSERKARRKQTSRFSFSNREDGLDLQSRQTVSSFGDDPRSERHHQDDGERGGIGVTEESLRDGERGVTEESLRDGERGVTEESLRRRRRRCSSYRSYNSLEDNSNSNKFKNHRNRRFLESDKVRKEEYSSDYRCPESDHYDLKNYEDRSQTGYDESSAYRDSESEESLQDRPHHSEEREDKHPAYESGSHSDHDKAPNGGEGSDDQSESLHKHGEYDSAYSTDNNDSKCQNGSDPDAHDKCNKSKNRNSESEGFVQSDSGEDSRRDKRHEKRQESIQWKSSSSADIRDERASLGLETSQSNHRHCDDDPRRHPPGHPPRKRARADGDFKHCEAKPGRRTKVTDISKSEHDEMSKDPPVLHETLAELDLEYSRLDSWMKHQLFPMEIEKITSAIKSAHIPWAPNKKMQLGPEEGEFDEVISKCRRKRIRWVIKAEFEQVRLKLVQEIERSSQVVVQEILQSF